MRQVYYEALVGVSLGGLPFSGRKLPPHSCRRRASRPASGVERHPRDAIRPECYDAVGAWFADNRAIWSVRVIAFKEAVRLEPAVRGSALRSWRGAGACAATCRLPSKSSVWRCAANPIWLQALQLAGLRSCWISDKPAGSRGPSSERLKLDPNSVFALDHLAQALAAGAATRRRSATGKRRWRSSPSRRK